MMVSFSGIDSSGKTTQIQLLEEYCIANKINVSRAWGKARGTPGVLFLKELLRKDKKLDSSQKLEYRDQVFQNPRKQKLLLFASLLDLMWYFGIYYRLLSIKYSVLILDRYIWDTYIEVKTEFSAINLDKWFLWKMVLFVSPKPKISFLFLIPPEVSIERDINKNDLTVDSLSLKKEKIGLYYNLKNQGKWSNQMDGLRAIKDIHSDVINICFH